MANIEFTADVQDIFASFILLESASYQAFGKS